MKSTKFSLAMRALAVVVLVSLVGIIGTRADAQTKSWEFVRWETAMAVQENGDINVRETHSVRFTGSFSFYTRTISHKRIDDIEIAKVVDETNNRELLPGEYDISPTFFGSDAATEVEIHFSLRDTVQTWSIYYKVKGGVGFFEDHDELYWNVISSDRDVPIESIETVVQLPQEVDPSQIQTTYYESGVREVTQEVIDGLTIRFTAGKANPGSDFTIVTGWPTGIVQNPGIVRVESFPDDADVIVAGVDTFLETPVGLRRGRELTGPGPFTVQVRKYGITSQRYQVEVEPGATSVQQISVFDT
ncbi:MAG: DUF2207 domain-containing protein, partial [bacterium]|nr:DUF2207 domain-containing protein [bacterium]